ncbi:MAG TPA: HNH endonuclease family protein [Candidatus Saccharimonadales bacterium]|nr:HNH endonuclease family protein [Candidatus Saccharimonadales bacterium]
MRKAQKLRRTIAAVIISAAVIAGIAIYPEFQAPTSPVSVTAEGDAAIALEQLEVKGRASKTGYERSQFGDGWSEVDGCDTRNIILHRDLKDTQINDRCQVVSGVLHDPYTGNTIEFKRGAETSDDIQIDHVVALSDAWQKGAQQLSFVERVQLANDPLELLAVDGAANQQKGDGDAATWLPKNKSFRCQYIARQIAVKQKYRLWVTRAEKDAMLRVLSSCPGQPLPTS